MARQPSIDNSPANAQIVAATIFTHCFPLVLADTVRRAHPMALHQVQFVLNNCEALAPGLVDDDPRVVMTSAWIDLAEGPVVLRLPNTHGRYLSVTLIDSAGEPFASVGSRTNDDVGVDLALAGPRWRGEVPGRLTARRAPSDGVWAVSRLHAHSAADRAEAEGIAKRQCVALIQRDADPHHAPMLGRDGPAARLESPPSPCLQQVFDVAPADYFHRLGHILDRAPAHYQQSLRPAVDALRSQLGGPPEASEWSREFEVALTRGLAEGAAAIRAAAAQLTGDDTIGWRPLGRGGEPEAADALTRAAWAFAAMGAPVREDVLAFACSQDEAGRVLSGAERYRIHFPNHAAPPVEGFWWLSTRPAAPDDRRRGLGDRSDLALNPDGSLDIIIQSTPPAVAQIPNWLASPEGEFTLDMRLYWPRQPALDGAWRMPPVERLGSGFARRASLQNPPPTTLRTPPNDDLGPAPSARRMTP